MTPIIRQFTAFLIGLFIWLAPLIATAEENEPKRSMREIAEKIVESLPIDKKIILKSLSPEKSGLPEEFLKSLLNDLEAELLTASEFKIKLANRFTTEELWSEAIEFGDANFDELYSATQAKLIILMSTRATAMGIEVSASVYNLLGDHAGQVIASSGTKYLDIDTEKLLGINLENVNENISSIKSQILELQKSGGVIKNPTDFSEFVHNARSYKNNGVLQLSQSNYEAALVIDPMFFDVLDSYLRVLVARFGRNGAIKYYEAKVRSGFNESQNSYSTIFLYGRFESMVSELNSNPLSSNIIPPLLMAWMPTIMTTSSDVFITPFENREELYGGGIQSAWYFAGFQLRESLFNGQFSKFFLDSENFLVRAEDIIWNWELTLRNSEFVCSQPAGACKNVRKLRDIKKQIWSD